jgi:hypothetical protein
MNVQLTQFGHQIVDNLIAEGLSTASPGSGMHLLFGPVPSSQSLNIKFGRAFEKWFEEAVRVGHNNFTVMKSGVWKEISKDLDLIFRDDDNNIIYYRELKLNLNLDTEKIVSTYEKIAYIRSFLHRKYPGYEIDAAALTWGVYDKDEMTAQSKIKKAAKYDIAVEDPSAFFKLVGTDVSKPEYSDFFRHLGERLGKLNG